MQADVGNAFLAAAAIAARSPRRPPHSRHRAAAAAQAARARRSRRRRRARRRRSISPATWVAIVFEDWRWRMGVGRRGTSATCAQRRGTPRRRRWDPAADAAAGDHRKASPRGRHHAPADAPQHHVGERHHAEDRRRQRHADAPPQLRRCRRGSPRRRRSRSVAGLLSGQLGNTRPRARRPAAARRRAQGGDDADACRADYYKQRRALQRERDTYGVGTRASRTKATIPRGDDDGRRPALSGGAAVAAAVPARAERREAGNPTPSCAYYVLRTRKQEEWNDRVLLVASPPSCSPCCWHRSPRGHRRRRRSAASSGTSPVHLAGRRRDRNPDRHGVVRSTVIDARRLVRAPEPRRRTVSSRRGAVGFRTFVADRHRAAGQREPGRSTSSCSSAPRPRPFRSKPRRRSSKRATRMSEVIENERIVELPLTAARPPTCARRRRRSQTGAAGKPQHAGRPRHLGGRRPVVRRRLHARRRDAQQPVPQPEPAAAVPRRAAGIPVESSGARRPERHQLRRLGERRHQVGHEPLPRRPVRVLPQPPLQRDQPFNAVDPATGNVATTG